MKQQLQHADAVVVGGGFYGVTIAVYLAKIRNFKRVVLIEKEPKLLARASFSNQARVHNGYHYPRSFTTAFRSRVNLPRFLSDWPQAVYSDFIKLYAIARKNSKVTGTQFERFCNEIGAKFRPAESSIRKLFEPRLIEKVYLVEEYAFDSLRLAEWAERELDRSGVECRFLTRASGIARSSIIPGLSLDLLTDAGDLLEISSRYVFNCTYSGLNQIAREGSSTRTSLKQEVTEMALVEVPAALNHIGVTVMDGPFFSVMPFPARNLHTLSHVRYTPHFSWSDRPGVDPYKKLEGYGKETRVDRMLRDVRRYLPSMAGAKYVESLFEVKTVLAKNESDDGRPILFEKHYKLPGFYSVLGGKIDNIYDILERLELELHA
ncbi:MAG: FAD-dependent oxidoreductase [Bdellovibrio sp.]